MMIANETTPTADLANEIARLMVSEPDGAFDLDDVLEMIPGMTGAGARAALAVLLADGRAEEVCDCYRASEAALAASE